MTQRGQKLRRYFSPYGNGLQTIEVVVRRGRSYRRLHDHDGTLNDLNQWFILRPGRYKMLVKYRDGLLLREELVSNPVEFQVE